METYATELEKSTGESKTQNVKTRHPRGGWRRAGKKSSGGLGGDGKRQKDNKINISIQDEGIIQEYHIAEV